MKYIKRYNEEFFHFGDEPNQPKFELDENNKSFDMIVELLERDLMQQNKNIFYS
jgi:hypothetical protein